MIEVFKTNVREVEVSVRLTQTLHEHFPNAKISFDLEDCDNILKIESDFIDHTLVMSLLAFNGCHCEVLPDFVP
jgi:hypothetical protein